MANAAVGEVEIELAGKVETLRCTLPAARMANQVGGGGGFLAASAKIATLDFEAYVAIIAAGLGKKPADVEQSVFSSGVANLSGPVSTFVTYLANGGRPPKDEDSTGSGEG